MNKTIIRNLAFFSLLLICIISSFVIIFVSGRQELQNINQQILHSYDISLEIKKLRRLVTRQELLFYEHVYAGFSRLESAYEDNKTNITQTLSALSRLAGNDTGYQARIKKAAEETDDILKMLDNAWSTKAPLISLDDYYELQTSADRTLEEIFRAESKLLAERYERLNERRIAYYNNLLLCGCLGALLLITFNAILFFVQFKRVKAETALVDRNHHIDLIIRGSSDAFFDINAASERATVSARFFEMLGREPVESLTLDELRALVHPEDQDKFWQTLSASLTADGSEYTDTYRLIHNEGRWVWVNSRGRFVRDMATKDMHLIGATTDITYLRRYQEKVEGEKEQAIRADRAKSAFLAHMSHEIRTPLTSIVGAAEILSRQQDNLTPKQTKMIDVLKASSISLRELVTGILDFSRIESGNLTLDIRATDFQEILNQIRAIAFVTAQEKNIELNVGPSPIGNEMMMTDGTRLRQVLVNLVGNALKFTSQGNISIRSAVEEIKGEKFLSVAVSDTGIGIAEEKLDRIFERFQQENPVIGKIYGGSGLGLSISRELARLLGGSIKVASEQGKGSVFTLLVPLKLSVDIASTHSHVPTASPLSLRKHADRMRLLAADQSHVLIADDYDGNVVILSSMLEDAGVSYDVARNGQEAVEMWKQHHYDLILTDVKMPVMDGYEAARRIRELESNEQMPKTPIVCMTAHAMMESRNHGVAAGMDDFLDKPISYDDLNAILLRYIRRKNAKTA